MEAGGLGTVDTGGAARLEGLGRGASLAGDGDGWGSAGISILGVLFRLMLGIENGF